MDEHRPIHRSMQCKYQNSLEYTEFQKNPSLEVACKLWGAKEAVLKYLGDKTINYRNDIQIKNINSGKAKYLKLDFNVNFESVEEMILTTVTSN